MSKPSLIMLTVPSGALGAEMVFDVVNLMQVTLVAPAHVAAPDHVVLSQAARERFLQFQQQREGQAAYGFVVNKT